MLVLVLSSLLLSSRALASNGSDTNEGSQVLPSAEAIEKIWKPKNHQFSRYDEMLNKAPFGRVPVSVASPVKATEAAPVEEEKLAIAAVSVVDEKPLVYLVDLETRVYQRINSEGENKNKIRLIKVSDEANPREVVAKVMISGRLSTVKYDPSLFAASAKKKEQKGGGINASKADGSMPEQIGGEAEERVAKEIQARPKVSIMPRRRRSVISRK